jgi:hypothetical protein
MEPLLGFRTAIGKLDDGAITGGIIKAFSSEVDAGSREENASK